jgi:hypothetical protein
MDMERESKNRTNIKGEVEFFCEKIQKDFGTGVNGFYALNDTACSGTSGGHGGGYGG